MEEGGGEANLPGRFVERLALLRGQYRGQLRLVLQHEVSDPLQVSRPLLGRGLSPVLKGFIRSINSELSILQSAVLDSLERLVIVRVEDSEGVARQAVSPLPIDKSLNLSQHLPRTASSYRPHSLVCLTSWSGLGCPGGRDPPPHDQLVIVLLDLDRICKNSVFL